MPSLIGTGLLIAATLAAFWRGRIEHRVVAAVIAAAWLLSGLVQDRVHWNSPQWALSVIDGVVVIGVTGAALRWGGFWLLACAAFTWLQLMTHAAMAVDVRIHARGYLTALGLWSVAQLLALAWGTFEAWRERRRAVA